MVNSEAEEDEFIFCDLCNLLFNDVNTYEKHKIGSKHLKKEKTKKNKEILKNDGYEDGEDDLEIVCKVCDKTFSGIVPFKQHLKSGPHFKALNRQKLLEKSGTDDVGDDSEDDDIVPKAYASCDVCKKQFTGPESYRDHMISKGHKKKRREMKYLKLLVGSEEGSGDRAENTEATSSASAVEKPVESEANQIEILKRQLLQTAEDTLSDEESSDKMSSCEQCGKFFSGPAPLMQHLVSKLHKKKLKQLKILGELKSKIPSDSEKSDEEEAITDDDDDELLACVTCGMSFSGPESMMAHLKGKSHRKKIAFLKAKAKVLKKFVDDPQTKVKHPPASAPQIANDPELPSNSVTSTQPKQTPTSQQNDDSNASDPGIMASKQLDPNRENVHQSLKQSVSEKPDHPGSEPESRNDDEDNEKRKRKRSNIKKVATAVLEIVNDI